MALIGRLKRVLGGWYGRLLLIIFTSTALLPMATVYGKNSDTGSGGSQPAATYVGSGACMGCHQQESRQWVGSHHDQAMQVASEATVLGDFNNAEFSYAGITSTFYKQTADNEAGGKPAFRVKTDGADGDLQDFEVRYTFGVYPLQQYLVAFENGHYQALNIAWDSRPAGDGGQRWFHLYPDENIVAGDPLHWTGPHHKWNNRCAECHSTDFQKNYSAHTNSYNSQWSEIDVACEACHGPASEHVAWVTAGGMFADDEFAKDKFAKDKGNRGFTARLGKSSRWVFDQNNDSARNDSARNSQAVSSSVQIDTCAVCHSRRSKIGEHKHIPGHDFLDNYTPALLDQGLYFADGQALDEVYVYGSFLQSKMHQQGVECSDCHNPHSLELKAEGNGVCLQCHKANVFDMQTHHRHPQDSSGAQCVNCHMPERTYMVVDNRRDHSFRIPDPVASKQFGVPNACNQCHGDQTVDWAVNAMQQWSMGPDEAHYSRQLLAARAGGSPGLQALQRLAATKTYPAIVRASAWSEMPVQSPADIERIAKGLHDDSALVRMGAVRALQDVPIQYSLAVLWPLLDDESQSVRLEVARLLAATLQQGLSDQQRARLQQVIDEYIAAQKVSADMGAAQVNLALLYVRLGQLAQAEQSYKQALALEPTLLPALVNLADLYRQLDRDWQGKPLLKKALALAPQQASVQHAMGLLLVRQKRYEDALAYLEKAYQLAPAQARYAYIYAVALNSQGRRQQALQVLDENLQRFPQHLESVQLRQSLQAGK